MNALHALLASCLPFIFTSRILLLLVGLLFAFYDFDPLFYDICSVKFEFNIVGQKFCTFMAFFTALFYEPVYLLSFIAMTGIAISSDIFHMYIWLEVLTIAFLFIQTNKQVVNLYWKAQLLLSILILWATLYCYNCTGSLTIPIALSEPSSAMIWIFFWLLKCGFPWIIICYRDIEDKHIAYVSALAKIGIVAVSKGEINLTIAILFTIIGIILALSQHSYREVLCGHVINQVGLILIAISLDSKLGAIYLVYATIIKAILFTTQDQGRLSAIYILALAGLPPNIIFFIKLSLSSISYLGLIPLISSFFTFLSLKKFILKGRDNFQEIYTICLINLYILIDFIYGS